MAADFRDIEGNVGQAALLTCRSDSDADSSVSAVIHQPSASAVAANMQTQRKAASLVKKFKKHRPHVPPDMNVIHRKPKRGVPLPSDPRLMGQPQMMAQSAAGGWVEESDSDDAIDVFEEVSKMRMDPSFQIYLIVGIVVLVLAVVGSVRLHEFVYGKPEIPENTFDFLRKDDNEDL